MPLRLVTINTAKEDRPYRHRLTLLTDGLAALRPDIVLLQETFNTPDGRFNTTRALADALDLTAVEAPARCKPRMIEDEIIESSSGLGLLSRLPVIAHERMALPLEPRDGERIALLVRLATEGGELLIVNTHLTHLRDHAVMRQRQFKAIFTHPWLSRPWRACILGGDLNTPVAELPALLTGLEHCSLRDAYVAGGGREPRATMPSFWSPLEGRCLDYLLSVVPAGVSHPRFADSAVVLATPDGAGVYPSDHRGVFTTLHLEEYE